MASALFEYQPVRSENKEIRLLTIYPAKSLEAPIVCSLHNVSLRGNPKYEAMSYTWGDESNQSMISLCGQQFPVRENLFAALRRLRKDSTARTIWIDAICIDQDNLVEKGYQLPLMTSIYQTAEQVCIWLGELSPAGAVGMKSFTSGYAQFSMGWKMWKTHRKHSGLLLPTLERFKSWESTQIAADLARELELGEIRELLSRPWWTRVWIMQEAIVAKKLVFMCGNETAPWESIDKTVARARKEKGAVEVFGIVLNSEFSMLDGSYRLLSDLRRRWAERTWDVSVYELLYEFRRLHCFKPVDRIYGFLGLVTTSLDFKIDPDYKASIQQVYTSFARTLIERTGSLDILNCKREWKGVPVLEPPLQAYSLVDQAKYHDIGCMIQDGPGKKPRPSWVRLPPGWERLEHGKSCYYYNWNSRTPQDHSPYSGLGPQAPQAVGKQRILPKGWEKKWDNLGIAKVAFSATEATRRSSSQSDAQLSRLPSWVPNWAAYTLWDPQPLLDWSNNTPRYCAGGTDGGTVPDHCDPRTLILEGVHFDTIIQIAEPWHPQSDIPPMSRKGIDVLKAWENLATGEVVNCPYGGPTGRKDALWRSHIADYVGDLAAPATDRHLLECWYDRVGWAKELPDLDDLAGKGLWSTAKAQAGVSHMDSDFWTHYLNVIADDDTFLNLIKLGFSPTIKRYGEYVKRIRRVCAHRALFVTKRGYIGLAPWNANLGDEVFVLKQGKTPYILRQLPAVGGYRLVGEAYVHGIMGGEAFLSGSLVQEVRII